MRTIVWDIDDVLNDLMRAWFLEAWKPAHPQCTAAFEDLRENPPHRILGVERSEYLASLDDFRMSERGRDLTANPAILGWLAKYGRQHRHVALTARPLNTAPYASEWLFRHFGAYFRCFGVVPSRPEPATPVYDNHKGDFLNWMGGADLFVDDSEENVALAEGLGIRAMLYPQPWNRSSVSVPELLNSLMEQVDD